ncbi:MAG: ATP-dependent helicase, partial [Propionibacteriaceae bacterium]|nr:ATP-dependent helicase [Propionibacteriaceae bacterium]
AADNMGQFGRLFPQADGSSAPSYPLRINRRSGAGIVALANAVATRLPAQAMPLEACADKAPGLIEARSFVTWPDEVAAVAARVVEAHRLGQAQLWSDAAVLVRRNADVPALYKAMTSLGVPVEIVGLGGLLALPEVASVVALLHLALDPADNPSAALLVSGPVCGLGPADMEALARRARQLLGSSSSTTLLKPEPRLVDAIFDPGTELSLDAIERLRRLANHIRAIRRQRHESAVDLVQMAADELGLTAELAVPSTWAQATAAQMRRFVAQVADHAARVGPVSLDGLLAWLHAEAVFGDQLDQATQSDDDSVKLLTVHKAKGLEWSVVLLPSLAMNIFPNDRVGDSPVKNADALPFELRLDAASLPKMRDVTNKSLTQFADALKADQIASEDRLSYVAVSRAKSVLVASTSAWRAGWATPRQPSRLFDAIVAEATASTGLVILEPDFGETNPLDAQVTVVPWPTVLPPDDQARLDQLAAAVMADEAESEPIVLSAEDAKRVAAWRAEAVELAERASARPMTMPTSLSASALLQARRDPAAFFASVARPMPRLADDAAMRGTLFHRWVEQRFSLASTLDEVDEVFDDDIAELVQAFEAGPYAQRSPLAVEAPFVAVIAGQQVRGRIDAVYKNGDGRYQIVDWKTSAGLTADPVQLAVYRLAWAQVAGCRPGDVDAVFYYVGQNKVVRPRLVAPDEIETWVKALRSSTWLEQKEVS